GGLAAARARPPFSGPGCRIFTRRRDRIPAAARRNQRRPARCAGRAAGCLRCGLVAGALAHHRRPDADPRNPRAATIAAWRLIRNAPPKLHFHFPIRRSSAKRAGMRLSPLFATISASTTCHRKALTLMQESITILEGKRILLGVTGSIACYKAVDLASKLTQAGSLVDVIMTEAAQRFVLPITFQAVTGRPVYTSMWNATGGDALPTHIAHVGLGEAADLFVIAPATADTLARLALGRADDLLAVTALAARCPLLIAPAMDGGMYEHPATQANLSVLRDRGARIIEPEEGRFASGLEGRGRLPDTPVLMGAIRAALGANGPLAGRRLLITAGGTREPLD